MSRDSILDNLKDNISVSNFRKEKARKDKIKSICQGTFALILCSLSITGIVFARDISARVYENFWHTGSGIGKAMEEGYIEEPEMEPQNSVAVMEVKESGEKIEDLETSVKVDELVMDDFNLSLTFNVTLSDKALEIAKAEEIWGMDFTDMVIKDENDYVVYIGSDKYSEFDIEDEKVINTGINSFLQERKGNTLKVIYNIYTGSAHFPKSKKLNIEFSKINISKEDDVATMFGEGEITFTGNWKFSVDVPEKMYNRQSIEYKQKSSTNDDYKITSAVLYDTGMELNVVVENVGKLPEWPTSPEIEFYKTLPEDSEIKSSEISSYLYNKLEATGKMREYSKKYDEAIDLECYLLNESGEKFGRTEGPRENGGKKVSGNGELIYNAMFDLTKYDGSDEIKVVLTRHGKEETIILEKKGEN